MSIESISASFESITLSFSLSLRQITHRWYCFDCVSLEWTQSARPNMRPFRGMNRNFCCFFFTATEFRRSKTPNWKKVIERGQQWRVVLLRLRPSYFHQSVELQTSAHLSTENVQHQCDSHNNLMNLWIVRCMTKQHTQQFYFIIESKKWNFAM